MNEHNYLPSKNKPGWPIEGLEHLTNCPICGESARNFVFSGLTDRVFFCAPGKWSLYRCSECKSLYLDPRPTAKTMYFAYSYYYTHETFPQKSIIEIPNIPLGKVRHTLRNGYLNKKYGYKMLLSLKLGFAISHLFPYQKAKQDRLVRHLPMLNEHPKLLDVGCGNGSYLKQMKSLGWEVIGLDPDRAASQNTKGNGMTIINCGVEDNPFKNETFDAITMNHVIEHLYEPLLALKECYRILRPGGLLWIATPNIQSLGFSIFNSNWLHLDPPRHLVLFNFSSLENIVEDAGFRVQSRMKNFEASLTWKSSNAIKKGSNDVFSHQNHKLKDNLMAALANLISWYAPGLAEEIIVIAKK